MQSSRNATMAAFANQSLSLPTQVTLHPAPSTLHPAPSTLRPPPSLGFLAGTFVRLSSLTSPFLFLPAACLRSCLLASPVTGRVQPHSEIVDDAALRAPWFLAVATNEDSVGRLRGQPSGVFVVRQSNTIPNAFIMSYRHNRKTHHVVLPWDQDGVCLVQSSKVPATPRPVPCVPSIPFRSPRPLLALPQASLPTGSSLLCPAALAGQCLCARPRSARPRRHR